MLLSPSRDGGVLDLALATGLPSNQRACSQGSEEAGRFDVDASVASDWLMRPNVNGRSNAVVLRPLRTARELTTRPREAWIVDFGRRGQEEAQLFEAPFAHVEQHVRPQRVAHRDRSRREHWWLHGRTGDELRAAVAALARVIVTARAGTYGPFVWMHLRVYVDDATARIARAADTTFGLLHGRLHELWSLRLGTSLEDRPRYTSTTCFETFPFPASLAQAHATLDAAVAAAYGWADWSAATSDEEILRRLLALNRERATV